jgi:hypothetical protein
VLESVALQDTAEGDESGDIKGGVTGGESIDE